MEKHLSYELRPRTITRVSRICKMLSAGSLLLFSLVWVCAATAQEYEASAVDTMPKVIRQMPINYPSDAKRDRVEGKVMVRVLIGTSGKAEKLEITESEPEGVFDDAALKSLKYWQFRPGILNGELVATWVTIPLNFKLD